MISGIIFGLGAASSQSFSYLFSRSFVGRFGTSFELLVYSHILMGIISLLILPFLPISTLPEFSVFCWPLIACTLTYFFGQFCFFVTVRYAEPSRIAPLLGLKIIYVAVLGVLFFNVSLSPLQWAAAAVCLGGALVSNWTGGTLPAAGIMWLLATCTGYTLSDLYIRDLIDAMGRENLITNSVIATVYVYTLCGLIAIPMLIYQRKQVTRKKIIQSMPFSIAWYMAMLLLFLCFGTIGPVYGNIVQSSRGIISILLGAFISPSGTCSSGVKSIKGPARTASAGRYFNNGSNNHVQSGLILSHLALYLLSHKT